MASAFFYRLYLDIFLPRAPLKNGFSPQEHGGKDFSFFIPAYTCIQQGKLIIMKVNLSSSAGFCIGVRRAIDKAVLAAEKEKGIYMLGDIVHNEFVVSSLRTKGVKKIKRLGKGAGKTLLIRAHGSPRSVYRQAEKAGYRIIDATCPMVKEIHRLVQKQAEEGRDIIVIGDKNHEEVLGIKGAVSSEVLTIDPREALPVKKIRKIEKASVVVQSTQETRRAVEIYSRLSELIKDVRFFDTVCNPTKTRQQDAYAIPGQNDAVIVIGSRDSANTRRLYDISKKLNRRTYLVSSAAEIDQRLFRDVKSVGVLAGASTPESLIDEAVRLLSSM